MQSADELIRCPACGAQNRVPHEKIVRRLEPICGRCKTPLPVDTAAQRKPLSVTDATFAADVERSPLPVLLDIWAPWCGPCLMLAPILDQLAAESQGQYRIAKLNVDENIQTATRFRIGSIPTMLIFKDGKLIDRIVGVQPKQAIAERLRLAARSAA